MNACHSNYRIYFSACRYVKDDSVSDMAKSAVCEALAVNESRLLDGASEYLQLMDVATVIMTQKAK